MDDKRYLAYAITSNFVESSGPGKSLIVGNRRCHGGWRIGGEASGPEGGETDFISLVDVELHDNKNHKATIIDCLYIPEN